jgi:two-component system sensor histidine kinase CreC
VSRPNQTLEPYIQRSRDRILNWSWGLLGISLAIGLLFTWWMASSLSRLRGYANAVARGERAELPRMGRLSGNTEFSDLAQAGGAHAPQARRQGLCRDLRAHADARSRARWLSAAAELLQEPLPEPTASASRQHPAPDRALQQQLIDRPLRWPTWSRCALRTWNRDLAAYARAAAPLEPRLRLKDLRGADLAGEGAHVRGNRFLLAQALQNLLDNAIDFSPQGGALTLRLTQDGGRVEWSVRDQGPGVPDYALGRIFERFYSLPRSDTRTKAPASFGERGERLHGGTLRSQRDPRGGCAS